MRWLVLLGLVVACVAPMIAAAQEPTVTPTVAPSPSPTVLATSVSVSGTPVVVVGYGDGAQGVLLLLIAVNLFGFTSLVLLKIADLFLLRR